MATQKPTIHQDNTAKVVCATTKLLEAQKPSVLYQQSTRALMTDNKLVGKHKAVNSFKRQTLLSTAKKIKHLNEQQEGKAPPEGTKGCESEVQLLLQNIQI